MCPFNSIFIFRFVVLIKSNSMRGSEPSILTCMYQTYHGRAGRALITQRTSYHTSDSSVHANHNTMHLVKARYDQRVLNNCANNHSTPLLLINYDIHTVASATLPPTDNRQSQRLPPIISDNPSLNPAMKRKVPTPPFGRYHRRRLRLLLMFIVGNIRTGGYCRGGHIPAVPS